MLSTLPKLADKSFIVGFLLPVILFLVALLFLFSDVGWVLDILHAFLSRNKIEQFVYIALLVWCLSVFMMMLNQLLYQIVEGYKWPISKFSQLWSRERRRFEEKRQRFKELEEQWWRAKEDRTELKDDLKREHDMLLKELVTQFPSEDQLLPTRFGNAIRAFEDYGRQVYGADGIPLWIHLNTVIPKEFQDALEDAMAQVSFLLNLLVFAVIIFVASMMRFLFTLHLPHPFRLWNIFTFESISFASFAFCAVLVVWLSYKFSIGKIYQWGEFVKASFDCYLPDLAKRLGYKLPLTGDDQRRFWIAVSRRAIYHRPFKSEEWPRADDLDQGADHDKIGSATGQENVSDGVERDGDDANGGDPENEAPGIWSTAEQKQSIQAE